MIRANALWSKIVPLSLRAAQESKPTTSDRVKSMTGLREPNEG
jgi:hypothetical protein